MKKANLTAAKTLATSLGFKVVTCTKEIFHATSEKGHFTIGYKTAHDGVEFLAVMGASHSCRVEVARVFDALSAA